MPLPTVLSDLSTTAASNYPAGSDSPTVLDDVQRAHAAFIAQLRDYFPATPSGLIFDYAGTSAPSGYLLCDGAAVSRATYSALFAKISTTWGVGDGSTTFNVPDLRRRTTIGSGGTSVSGPAATVGAVGGAETVTIAAGNLPPHAHSGTTGGMNANNPHTHADSGHSHGVQVTASSYSGATGVGNGILYPGNTATGYANITSTDISHGHAFTTGNGPGASTALANMQPSAVVTKIIKT